LLSALLHRQAARGALTVDGSGTEGALPDGWSNPTRTWWLVDYPRQRRCGLIVFFCFVWRLCQYISVRSCISPTY
jgi:hypothetical protein